MDKGLPVTRIHRLGTLDILEYLYIISVKRILDSLKR